LPVKESQEENDGLHVEPGSHENEDSSHETRPFENELHVEPGSHENEDSSHETRPFENEIHMIDYNAQMNRDYGRHDYGKSSTWNLDSQHHYISRNSYLPDSSAAGSHVQRYSTLPDEVINTQSSTGDHDLQYSSAAGQEFQLFNYQNPADRQAFQSSNNQYPADEHEFRFKNQNSGNGQGSRFSVQNSPVAQNTRFNSHNFGSGQLHDGRQDSRYTGQNFGNRHQLQYNGQESGLKNQNFGRSQDMRSNTQNPVGRYKNQNSASGEHSSESVFFTSHGNSGNKRPHRETEQGIGGAENFGPNSDELYYQAFRSFSFRRNPTESISKGTQSGSFSGGSFNGKGVPHSSVPSYQSGVAHGDRPSNKWFNGGNGSSKDHDIGFFEGLEDINDR
jgi:hypothetical protein